MTEPYIVDYRILVPEWDNVVVHATDADEAGALATQEAEAKYPEATEIEIINVELSV